MQTLAKLPAILIFYLAEGMMSVRGGETRAAVCIVAGEPCISAISELGNRYIESEEGLREIPTWALCDELEGGHLLFDCEFLDLAISALGFVDTTVCATTNEANDLVPFVDLLLAVVAARGHVARLGGVCRI
jgi:hypothetical protein